MEMKTQSPLYSTVFANGLKDRPVIRPLLLSATIATCYVILCSAYIVFSSGYAARVSGSLAQMGYIEQLKGVVFVLATGLVYFACTFYLLSALARRDREILEHRKSIVFAERTYMASVFASSIAHDINNMVTAIQGNLELVETGIQDKPDTRRHLEHAREATTRLHAMNQRLLSLGREKTPGSRSMGDIVSVLRDVIEFASVHRKVKSCHLTHHLPESLIYVFNPQMIRRAILNLIINGAEATSANGRIDVRMLDMAETIHIEVHDNGPGVPDSLREQILEPFFTTKDTGTGLGLLSLKVCAHEHDATLEIGTSDMGGACFRLICPKPPASTS